MRDRLSAVAGLRLLPLLAAALGCIVLTSGVHAQTLDASRIRLGMSTQDVLKHLITADAHVDTILGSNPIEPDNQKPVAKAKKDAGKADARKADARKVAAKSEKKDTAILKEQETEDTAAAELVETLETNAQLKELITSDERFVPFYLKSIGEGDTVICIGPAPYQGIEGYLTLRFDDSSRLTELTWMRKNMKGEWLMKQPRWAKYGYYKNDVSLDRYDLIRVAYDMQYNVPPEITATSGASDNVRSWTHTTSSGSEIKLLYSYGSLLYRLAPAEEKAIAFSGGDQTELP